MPPMHTVTLTARAAMEAGVIGALAYWGYHTGHGTPAQLGLAVAAPTIGFGIWGAIDFHQLGRLAEPLRLIEELAISGVAAGALYATGQHTPAAALALLSIAYHGIVYLQGDRLLPQPEMRG